MIFPTVTSRTWSSRVVFSAMECCTSASAAPGWAALQAHCGSSGIEAGGVEDGNPGLTVAELLNYSCPPTLPASLSLCSASTETSITAWMKDLQLYPPLNLKWGALCWCLQQIIQTQLQDRDIMIPRGITGAKIGLDLHQKLQQTEQPGAYFAFLVLKGKHRSVCLFWSLKER